MRRLLLGVLVALVAACSGNPEPRSPKGEPKETADRTPSPRHRPSSRTLERRELPSSLPIPVDGVEVSELSNSFDAPRSGGRRHQAIDIFAPRHTPIRAPIEGYVARKGMRSLGGRTISVVGPGGYRHYFAHLESWAGLDDGDYVRPGDVLGYVGNSGNAKGGPTHLHYAIYDLGGRAIDPHPLLRRGEGSFE